MGTQLQEQYRITSERGMASDEQFGAQLRKFAIEIGFNVKGQTYLNAVIYRAEALLARTSLPKQVQRRAIDKLQERLEDNAKAYPGNLDELDPVARYDAISGDLYGKTIDVLESFIEGRRKSLKHRELLQDDRAMCITRDHPFRR